MRVLDRATLEERATFRAGVAIWALATDGVRLYTGGEDGVMRAWDVGQAARCTGRSVSSALLTPSSPQTLEPSAITLAGIASGEKVRPSTISWPWRMTYAEAPSVVLMTVG